MSSYFKTTPFFRACLLGGIASIITAFAQNQAVRLSGKITDPSAAAVARAIVKLDNRDTSENFSSITDDGGNFSFSVPRGQYLLRAEAPGLTLGKSPQILALSNTQTISLRLTIPAVTSAVVVTGTGTPQSLDETEKAVDIVDRDQLQRRGIESTVDALRELPGMRISQRGGPGSLTTIQIRGLRPQDTSVLIDGMRFRDVGAPQGDAQSYIGDLLSVDVGRIEVLRGSGSSIYGTNATAGVVNIVTDAGSGPFHGDLTADGGGLGEFRGVAHLGGSALENRLHYSAGLGHLNVTRGVDNYNRYRNTTGNGLIDYSLRPGLVLRGRLLGTDGFVQLNNIPAAAPDSSLPPTGYVPAMGGVTFIPNLQDPDYFRTSTFISTLVGLDHQVNPLLSYKITYQALLTNRDTVNGPLGTDFQPLYRNSSQFNGRIDTLQGRVNLLAGSRQLLTAGYEFEREYFDSPSSDQNPDPAFRVNSNTQVSQRSNSFDAQDQIRLFQDRLQLSISGRLQTFNLSRPNFLGTVPVYANASAVNPPNAYTGDVSIAYFFKSSGTKIRSHGGNGYRAPSLYERFGTSFYGSSFTAYGDPRLRPDRSVGIDGGVDQYFASDRIRLSASYFYTRLQEVIAFDFSGLINPEIDPFGRAIGYRNTGGGMARGAELSVEAKPLRSMQLLGSYTYTNSRDKYSQFADGTLQAPRISPHSFSLTLLQQFGQRWDTALDFLAASDYLFPLSQNTFPFSQRTFIFPGPRQANLSIGYTHPLSESSRIRLYTSIKNLADQTFYEDGFRTPGRWAVAGITYSF
jgi:vitamin B12 transporter